jgi:hypothetical protein
MSKYKKKLTNNEPKLITKNKLELINKTIRKMKQANRNTHGKKHKCEK